MNPSCNEATKDLVKYLMGNTDVQIAEVQKHLDEGAQVNTEVYYSTALKEFISSFDSTCYKCSKGKDGNCRDILKLLLNHFYQNGGTFSEEEMYNLEKTAKAWSYIKKGMMNIVKDVHQNGICGEQQ